VNAPPKARLKVTVRGAVQGVGFRPFVYRLAIELDLTGWVTNSPQGVFLEVEGGRDALQEFLIRLRAEQPPRSFIQSLEASWLDPVGHAGFEIRHSQAFGDKTALVLPDIATCADCLGEIQDPTNRRYLYPFTNCTNCGPRFSIIESLPYDRANTSMKKFTICPDCEREYQDPRDRRFHAQPNACSVCGPHLELWNPAGGLLARFHEALLGAVEFVREGKILALKGIGGFQLIVDARNEAAVLRLRNRKRREEKPFALMFPSLAEVSPICEISALEERLLCSPEGPIVLIRSCVKNQARSLAPSVAPHNPNLGVMLPYTPLHHLLLGELGFPVIATSGNLSDEPICIDEREALTRLGNIADVFLVHNRPIVRPVDDSVACILLDREMLLRRARGYAPLPIVLNSPLSANSQTMLAVGAQLKSTVALAVGPQVFLSQHIGDLETTESYETFLRVIADFQRLYDVLPSLIAMDSHPDYLSTKFVRDFVAQASVPADSAGIRARGSNPNSPHPPPQSISVQHHLAHVHACMAENEVQPPALGVAWDGTGYGLDGTVWGGEFFLVTESSHDRVAYFRQFRLPGGDKAIKEPRRTAVGLLYEVFGDSVFSASDVFSARAFSTAELTALNAMLKSGFNSPLTSSVGRLFDAVAALIGLRQEIRFEGQAAMELEFALNGFVTVLSYPIGFTSVPENPGLAHRSRPRPRSSPLILDWAPMVKGILTDLRSGVATAEISAKFHNALIEALIIVAQRVGEPRVALSGGCFQNRYLTERAVQRLRQEGFHPYWHQRVPPNDGGIALGQIVAALRHRQ